MNRRSRDELLWLVVKLLVPVSLFAVAVGAVASFTALSTIPQVRHTADRADHNAARIDRTAAKTADLCRTVLPTRAIYLLVLNTPPRPEMARRLARDPALRAQNEAFRAQLRNAVRAVDSLECR